MLRTVAADDGRKGDATQAVRNSTAEETTLVALDMAPVSFELNIGLSLSYSANGRDYWEKTRTVAYVAYAERIRVAT